MSDASKSAPSSGSQRQRWEIAQERIQRMYDQADEFVLAVRSGKMPLSSAGAITGLLDRYGCFNIADPEVAFGATIGVIELMLGPTFGTRRLIDASVFVMQFNAMCEASAAVDRLEIYKIFELARQFAKPGSLGLEQPVRRQKNTRSRPAAADALPAPVKSPGVADFKRYVEGHMFGTDDLDLAVQVTGARILSETGIPLDDEFIRATILEIRKQREDREWEKQHEARHRDRLFEQLPRQAPVPAEPSPTPESEPDNSHETNGNGHASKPRQRCTNPLDLLDQLAQRREFKGTADDVELFRRAAKEDGLLQGWIQGPQAANRIREAIERSRKGT